SLIADKDEEQVERLLREAVRRGVLSERGLSAGEDCRFYHTILRRVLYEGLSPRRRKHLHQRTAQAIEAVYASAADRVAEALSVHYEAAGEFRRASDWAMRAWRASSSRSNWNEAVASIERAHRAACEIARLDKNELPPSQRSQLL